MKPRLALAALATVGVATLSSTALTTTAAHADPAWGPGSSPLVAVGSNTIEDLFDAFSGVAPTPGDAASTGNYHNFTPLSDNVAGFGTYEQVYSWDAANQNGTGQGDCISATPGFAPIARPNGSGDGNKALSAAISNAKWSKATSSGQCAAQDPNGAIELARSSGIPNGTAQGGLGDGTCTSTSANCIAWVDIAHDAVSYAYYDRSSFTPTAAQATQDSELSNAVIGDLYSSQSTGLYTYNGVTYMACLPQLGSGTEKFFLGSLTSAGPSGVPQGTAENAANASGCVNFEENGATTFQSYATTAFNLSKNSTAQVAVTPFSVGSWISQSNGYAFDRSLAGEAAGVQLGTIDAATSGCAVPPYSGSPTNGVTPGTEAPNTCFEESQLYGRELFVGMNNASLNGSASTQNGVLQDIFGYEGTGDIAQGPTANSTTDSGVICTAPYDTTDLTDFGFTQPGGPAAPMSGGVDTDCGQETITAIATATSGSYIGS